MQEIEFHTAQTVSDLCRILSETGGRIIAGGTDVIPLMQRSRFPSDSLVDCSRVDELRFIRQEDGAVQIGALTTYSDLLASSLLADAAPSLLEAAETVGCPQTRNRGTLGGNIANASPAGDTLPPMLTLDARVKLIGQGGERVLPLAEVLIGPGQTAIEPGEVLYSVLFSPMPEPSGTAFLKLGNRKGMNIAVASVAAAIHLNAEGIVDDVRIAFGSVAPTAVRSPHTEAIITGHPPAAELFEEAARAAMQDISPITDLRASAAYRRHAAAQLLRRALQSAVERGSVHA